MFIQANEKLLIEIDCGESGTDIIAFDGPMTQDAARDEYKGCDALSARRVDWDGLNIENVTDDLTPETIETDWSVVRHQRSMSDTRRFI